MVLIIEKLYILSNLCCIPDTNMTCMLLFTKSPCTPMSVGNCYTRGVNAGTSFERVCVCVCVFPNKKLRHSDVQYTAQ